MPDCVGSIALREAGGLVAALRSSLVFVDLDGETIAPLADPERDFPGNRFNDGKCDPQGRYWIASMDDGETRPSGNIWRLNPDLTCTRMDGGFVVGNGFGWSLDGRRMYFTDSAERTIYAYPFDQKNGLLGKREVFARIGEDEGFPDGLCVDAEDHVWSAHWDGWRVTRYRPDGSIERVVDMPVPRPTSLAFGGENLDRLFITSASIGLDQRQLASAPLSGGLFEFRPGVQGVAQPRCLI